MRNVAMEFQWWMVLIVTAMIGLYLIVRRIRDFFAVRPGLTQLVFVSFMGAVFFVTLGMLASATPAGTYEICTQEPHYCLEYIFKYSQH